MIDLDLTGHRDGYRLTWGGVEIDVFPRFDGAARARKAAYRTLAELSDRFGWEWGQIHDTRHLDAIRERGSDA